MNKRPTIKEIAKIVGVSPNTVHKVMTNKQEHRISEKVSKKVFQVAEELGYTPNRAAQGLSRNPVNIAVIFPLAHPEVYDYAEKGFKIAFDIYKDYNVHPIYFRYDGPSRYRDHTAIFQEILERDDITAVLMTPPVYSEEMAALMNAVAEKVQAVIFFATNEPRFSVDGYVAFNYEVFGQLAAQFFSVALRNDAKVAVFVPYKTLAHEQTVNAFCASSYIQTSPLIYEYHFDRKLMESQIDDVLVNHPDVEGIYITSCDAPHICKYIKQLGIENRFLVVGVDVHEELAECIRNDLLQATIFEDFELQAHRVVEKLVMHLLNNRLVPFESEYIRPQLVLKSNLECYIQLPGKELTKIDVTS